MQSTVTCLEDSNQNLKQKLEKVQTENQNLKEKNNVLEKEKCEKTRNNKQCCCNATNTHLKTGNT